MKQLTREQEKFVLRSLIGEAPLDSGSSRAVFACDSCVTSVLGLPQDRHYVIKLAVGHGGLNQHQREVECWLDYGNKEFMAEIYAAGQFVSIMEEVEVSEYFEFAEYVNDTYEDDPEVLAKDYLVDECSYELDDTDLPSQVELYAKVARSILFLNGINGDTSDNGQLGWTRDGRCVAYDYGFISGHGCAKQCSENLVGEIYDEDVFEYYVEQLCNILTEFESIENKLLDLMNAVEYDICSGDSEKVRKYYTDPKLYEDLREFQAVKVSC